MIPIVASALFGLAGKLVTGVVAGIGKRVMDAVSSQPSTSRTSGSPESFSAMIDASRAASALPGAAVTAIAGAPPSTMTGAPLSAIVAAPPSDIAARIAAEHLYLHALAAGRVAR